MASYQLSKKADRRLEQLAAKTGPSKEFLVRELTLKVTDQIEKKYSKLDAGPPDRKKADEADPCEKIRQFRGKIHFNRTAAQLRGDG